MPVLDARAVPSGCRENRRLNRLHLMTKGSPEMADERRLDRGAGDGLAQLLCHRTDGVLVNATGHNPLPVGHVRVEIEGEAVARNPASIDLDTDGGQLDPGLIRFDPNTGQALVA